MLAVKEELGSGKENVFNQNVAVNLVRVINSLTMKSAILRIALVSSLLMFVLMITENV